MTKTKTTLVRISESDLDRLHNYVHDKALPPGVHLTKTAVANWAVRYMLETLSKDKPRIIR